VFAVSGYERRNLYDGEPTPQLFIPIIFSRRNPPFIITISRTSFLLPPVKNTVLPNSMAKFWTYRRRR